jgi:hypothetical protein
LQAFDAPRRQIGAIYPRLLRLNPSRFP